MPKLLWFSLIRTVHITSSPAKFSRTLLIVNVNTACNIFIWDFTMIAWFHDSSVLLTNRWNFSHCTLPSNWEINVCQVKENEVKWITWWALYIRQFNTFPIVLAIFLRYIHQRLTIIGNFHKYSYICTSTNKLTMCCSYHIWSLRGLVITWSSSSCWRLGRVHLIDRWRSIRRTKPKSWRD